jgi:transposase-like protein
VAEKRRIVEETLEPDASVARVARAHRVNANQVFHWRRQGLLGAGNAETLNLLPSLQQRLVKTGGHLIKHARYCWLLAESHLTRRLFGSMLHVIAALPSPAG